jgi:hypothetical protein
VAGCRGPSHGALPPLQVPLLRHASVWRRARWYNNFVSLPFFYLLLLSFIFTIVSYVLSNILFGSGSLHRLFILDRWVSNFRGPQSGYFLGDSALSCYWSKALTVNVAEEKISQNLKGRSSEILIQFFAHKWKGLGLNMKCFRF